MLRKTILALLLVLAPLLRAGEPRPPFADDYKPSPCAAAAAGLCTSFNQHEIALWGARMQGVDIQAGWMQKHWKEITAAYAPYCAKLATCYATPGNIHVFCDDVVLNRSAPICDRFPAGSADHVQCRMFVRTFGTGIQLNSYDVWRKAQACAAKTPPGPTRKLEVWIEPATMPAGYSGPVTVHAIDVETRVPIQANVTIADENLYAKTPGGRPLTSYPIQWTSKLVRVKNAQGHRDSVPPLITIVRDGYETVTLPMPVAIPKMIIEMSPAATALKPGRNTVTFSARDAATGKPVDARIMLGDAYLGDIGLRDLKQTMVIELKRGKKRPEIWASSPFDAYDDVVVAPAQK